MILELKEVKEFLKIDFDDEDSLIQELIEASELYLQNATGIEYNNTNKLAKLYCRVLINEWYKDRGLMQDRAITAKVRYTLQSILLQLKLGDNNAM